MKKMKIQLVLLVVFLTPVFLIKSMTRLLSPNRMSSSRSALPTVTIQKRIPHHTPHFPDIQQLQPQPVSSPGMRSVIAPAFATTLALVLFGSEMMMLGLLASSLKNFWNKPKSSVLVLKPEKLTFAEKYYSGNRIAQSSEELCERLEQLAALKRSQVNMLEQHQEHEEQFGDENQATVWLFGNIYRYALDKAHYIADIILLYEAAAAWMRLRVENGLHSTADELNVEFDRVMRKENEVVKLYDEKSVSAVRQYLSDMRADLLNEFVQRLKAYQEADVQQE
jgi:hypothetical protein